MNNTPAFFKVFIPEFCSQRMQIPSAFTSNMRGELPEKETFLRDRYGNVWPVEVSRQGRDLYFEKGWVRFIEDNGVEVGDFLVIQFSGDYFFDFKHLGKSACEKDNAGSFNFTVKLVELELEEDDEDAENEEEEEEVDKKDASIGKEEEEEDDADNDHKEDEEYKEEEEEEEETDDDDDNDEDEEDNYKKDDQEEEKKEQESMHRSKKKVATLIGRRDVIEMEDEIFGSGHVPRPKHPYFVTKIRSSRPELHIPLDVIKDHDLKLPSEMDIRDEEGRLWHSKVGVWKCGRVVVKRGWKAFCKRNHLKMDDKCLCEFVEDRNKGQLLLQVRIFFRV